MPRQKLLVVLMGGLFPLFSFQSAVAQLTNFQKGMRTVTAYAATPYIYYASSNGNIYSRYAVAPWQDPPVALGNFFFGQPVPNDFPNGLYVVTIDSGRLPFLI